MKLGKVIIVGLLELQGGLGTPGESDTARYRQREGRAKERETIKSLLEINQMSICY